MYHTLIKIFIKRLDDWKLIRGCPGILTDWYNLTYFDTPDISHRDIGHTLSISYDPKSENCINHKSNVTFQYYLFNIDGGLTNKNVLIFK